MLFNLLMLCDIHNLRELTFITEKEFLKNLQWLLPHCPSELAYLLTLGTQHPLNSCLLRPVFPVSSHISQPGPLGVWACSQATTFPHLSSSQSHGVEAPARHMVTRTEEIISSPGGLQLEGVSMDEEEG